MCQPRLVLLSLASTSVASSRSPHSALVQELLARHRKCLFGNGFQGDVSADWLAPYRTSMYLETVLLLLLYHVRSFYSNLGVSSLTRDEVTSNRQVHLACVDLLRLLVNELLPLVRDSGKGFASYVSDLLTRCRLQKVNLFCCWYAPRQFFPFFISTFSTDRLFCIRRWPCFRVSLGKRRPKRRTDLP